VRRRYTCLGRKSSCVGRSTSIQANPTPFCLAATLALAWCATELRNLEIKIRSLQAPLTASPFIEAIYSHNGTVHDRILQVPNNVLWGDDSMRGGSLFVRDCYEKLWDCMSDENELRRCFSICSSSGIVLVYVMYRLARKGSQWCMSRR
jgi:hypothetical protein